MSIVNVFPMIFINIFANCRFPQESSLCGHRECRSNGEDLGVPLVTEF
jgi:hypothetical protein